MKANKRIRDPRRISQRRLYLPGLRLGVTTFPVDSGKKTNDVQEMKRR